MNKCIFIIPMFLLLCCNQNPQTDKGASSSDTSSHWVANSDSVDKENQKETDDQYETVYVVIVDTSLDYYYLDNKMFELNKKLKMPIDTMKRYYNESKNLIALPDNDEDESYAGNYFPRRFPAMETSDLTKPVPEYLSLEYLYGYGKPTTEKTIALVAGIYENESGADSALTIIKSEDLHAFVSKTRMYIGCIH
jgi:hypothetical protein